MPLFLVKNLQFHKKGVIFANNLFKYLNFTTMNILDLVKEYLAS